MDSASRTRYGSVISYQAGSCHRLLQIVRYVILRDIQFSDILLACVVVGLQEHGVQFAFASFQNCGWPCVLRPGRLHALHEQTATAEGSAARYLAIECSLFHRAGFDVMA
jgi:hypothetical protein